MHEIIYSINKNWLKEKTEYDQTETYLKTITTMKTLDINLTLIMMLIEWAEWKNRDL